MRYYPFNKLTLLSKNTPSGILVIYFNLALRNTALSLIGIFIPVYIFIHTQDYFGQGIVPGLYGVAAYYFLVRLVVLLFTVPAAQYIVRHGFRAAITLSNIALIVTLSALSLAPTKPLWLIPAILSHGVLVPFYWIAYHTVFAEDGQLDSFGEEISKANIINSLTHAVGPALGGIVIMLYGFPALFALASIIILLSGLPFLFVPSLPKKPLIVSYSGIWDWLKNKSHRNEEVAYLGRHLFSTVGLLFYPVFMYLIAGSFKNVGLLTSASFFLGIIATYFAGRLYDRRTGPGLLRFGAITTFFIWIGRSFVTTFPQLIALDLSMKSFFAFYNVPFDSMIYSRSRSKGENILTFVTAREIIVSLVYFITLIIIGFIIPFDWRWKGIFGLAAIGSLLSVNMWESKK